MCVHRETGAQRAVKVLRKSHMDDDEKKMLFNEINILRELVSAKTTLLILWFPSSLRVPSIFNYDLDGGRIFKIINIRNLIKCFQDHPNIVKMYEFFEDEKRYYIVTE